MLVLHEYGNYVYTIKSGSVLRIEGVDILEYELTVTLFPSDAVRFERGRKAEGTYIRNAYHDIHRLVDLLESRIVEYFCRECDAKYDLNQIE